MRCGEKSARKTKKSLNWPITINAIMPSYRAITVTLNQPLIKTALASNMFQT